MAPETHHGLDPSDAAEHGLRRRLDPLALDSGVAPMPDKGQVVLELEDVSVSYGNFRAVRNVDLDIRQGHITALIGPTGCGKTTIAQPQPHA